MITEEDLRKTNISMSFNISPVKNVICDLSAIIGNNCAELIGSFSPKLVSKKTNIVVTELLNNAIENIIDKDSNVAVDLNINKDHLFIKVMNVVNREQYEKVSGFISKINSVPDVKKLLAETIRERRKGRLKGGLGLIRLVAENKFNLKLDYKKPFLILESQISLGGLS